MVKYSRRYRDAAWVESLRVLYPSLSGIFFGVDKFPMERRQSLIYVLKGLVASSQKTCETGPTKH
jgi:hypothetical protein